jgi:Protein of unknown function (DUF2490)
MRFFHCLAVLTLAAVPVPALAASDDNAEFWINPSITIGVDERTSIEIETAQRLRDADDDGVDTYFGRLWINRKLDDRFTISAAIGRRINDGDADETRTHQQITYRNGIVRGRVRIEQRFIDDGERTGVRLRTRAGVSLPLDADGNWTGFADVEPFWTLRSTSLGGQDGLTGLRTQVGVRHQVTDNFEIGLAYVRQQDIRRNADDRTGHAPLISLELAL